MEEPSLEKTMGVLTQVNKIGFVEFTTDLVKNVYDVIVQSSVDQLKSFSELVKDVSGSVSDYQKKIGLEGDSLNLNCEKYAIEVLGLESSTTPTDYTLNGGDNATLIDKRNAIIADLTGFDFDTTTTTVADPKGTIQDPSTLPLPADEITITVSKENLDKLIAMKLLKGAEDNYNILVTILKIGMQKIVVDKGLIATKLTFHVDANQTASIASSNVNIKSKSFALSGGVNYTGKKVSANISGGYSNTSLSVSVINEKSSAVANMSADIVGEVKIEFRTDSFPSISK